jgi:hypothetical protein
MFCGAQLETSYGPVPTGWLSEYEWSFDWVRVDQMCRGTIGVWSATR